LDGLFSEKVTSIGYNRDHFAGYIQYDIQKNIPVPKKENKPVTELDENNNPGDLLNEIDTLLNEIDTINQTLNKS